MKNRKFGCGIVGKAAMSTFRSDNRWMLLVPDDVAKITVDEEDMKDFLFEEYTDILVEDGNRYYGSTNGCLIEKGIGEIVLTTIDATIPEDGSVKVIGPCAFNRLDEPVMFKKGYYEIPEGVEEIKYRAFACAPNHPVTLKIPKSVRSIGLMSLMIHSQKLEIIFEGDPEIELGAFGTNNELRATGNEILSNMPLSIYTSLDSLTICGHKGTNLEAYCKKYDITFKEIG